MLFQGILQCGPRPSTLDTLHPTGTANYCTASNQQGRHGLSGIEGFQSTFTVPVRYQLETVCGIIGRRTDV